MVALKLPAVVGVPLITPAAPSESPPGGLPPVAPNCALYGVLTVPPASGEVEVIVSLGTMVIEKVALAVCGDASVALTPKLKLPAAVGVPLNWPLAASRLKPPGSAPLATDHFTGGVAPEVPKENEYATPTMPLGSGEVEVMTNWLVMVIENDLLMVVPAASASCTLKLAAPAAEGVPLSTPLEPKPRPEGSVEPAPSDQV